MANKAKSSYEPRTAIYRMPAEAARLMYNSRSAADKAVPFKVYIVKCLEEENLLYPISSVELT